MIKVWCETALSDSEPHCRVSLTHGSFLWPSYLNIDHIRDLAGRLHAEWKTLESEET